MSISKFALNASSQDYIIKNYVTYPLLRLCFGGISMYLIRLYISKHKHYFFIATEEGLPLKAFNFENNSLGCDSFLENLKSSDQSLDIRISRESTVTSNSLLRNSDILIMNLSKLSHQSNHLYPYICYKVA